MSALGVSDTEHLLQARRDPALRSRRHAKHPHSPPLTRRWAVPERARACAGRPGTEQGGDRSPPFLARRGRALQVARLPSVRGYRPGGSRGDAAKLSSLTNVSAPGSGSRSPAQRGGRGPAVGRHSPPPPQARRQDRQAAPRRTDSQRPGRRASSLLLLRESVPSRSKREQDVCPPKAHLAVAPPGPPPRGHPPEHVFSRGRGPTRGRGPQGAGGSVGHP